LAWLNLISKILESVNNYLK